MTTWACPNCGRSKSQFMCLNCNYLEEHPRDQRPAAPDTTGGELREQIAILLAPHVTHRSLADAVLALPALRDLLAERDKLRAQVRAVANLHRPYADGESQCVACSADCRYCESDHLWPCATARALGLPTTP